MLFGITFSVILAVVVAFASTSAIWAVEAANGVEKDAGVKARYGDLGWKGLWLTIGAGVILGVFNFIAPTLTIAWIAFIPLVLTIFMLWCFCHFWLKRQVESPKEIVWSAIVALLILCVVFTTAARAAGVVPEGTIWFYLIGIAIPVVAEIATIGYFIDHKLYLESELNEGVNDKKSHHFLVAGRVVFSLAIAAMLAVVLGPLAANALTAGQAFGDSGSAASAQEEAAEKAAEPSTVEKLMAELAGLKAEFAKAQAKAKADEAAAKAVETAAVVDGAEVKWLHYYNLDLQDNGNDEDDFNFGPNPWHDGMTPAEADKEFRYRCARDTTLAAASTAWTDANVGTRFLGVFYESCKHDWAQTINDAAYRFAVDQEIYYQEDLDPWLAFLDKAKRVEIRECRSVTDQMYMNPCTSTGVPDVIVLETDDHSGHELVYVFEIKGQEFEVAFRIECGFQPTNVEAVMGITPQSRTTYTPSTPSTPGGGGGGGTPPTPSGNDPMKDPSKLTTINTEPNDNKGPGENTIDPNDPNHSTKDRDDNSTSYDSYEQYREAMDHLAEVNETQKTGGDSNQASTETPTGTTVDSNATSGTGNGGIDKPTPVDKPAETASGGAITNNSSDSATAWGDGNDPT